MASLRVWGHGERQAGHAQRVYMHREGCAERKGSRERQHTFYVLQRRAPLSTPPPRFAHKHVHLILLRSHRRCGGGMRWRRRRARRASGGGET